MCFGKCDYGRYLHLDKCELECPLNYIADDYFKICRQIKNCIENDFIIGVRCSEFPITQIYNIGRYLIIVREIILKIPINTIKS
jgi:hypothetical protein